MFFITARNLNGGTANYLMVYRGKDPSNSALLYMAEIASPEDTNWYDGLTCTANNDEGLTYCFMIRGGKMLAFEAYSRPKMNVIPHENYTLSVQNDTIPIKVKVKNVWNKDAAAENNTITLSVSLVNIEN